MNYKIRTALKPFILTPVSALLITALLPNRSIAQMVDFERVNAPDVSLSEHSYRRIEHFLTHVFPTRQMRRYTHVTGDRSSTPTRLRHVTYEVVSQEGLNFVLAGFSGGWSEPINELAIYRMENGGPNQVWRSQPWVGSSGGLHLQSVPIRGRNLVLFQEGGAEGEFSLASVFTFKNADEGLFLRDLTPELPWLRARAHFPFRTLYGEQISMQLEGSGSNVINRPAKNEVVLSASDEQFNLGMTRLVRPSRSWKYNQARGCFERLKTVRPVGGQEATNN